MPKILLVKTSLRGDVVHNLPVVTGIHAHISNATEMAAFRKRLTATEYDFILGRENG